MLDIFKDFGSDSKAALIKLFGFKKKLDGTEVPATSDDLNADLNKALNQIGMNPMYTSAFAGFMRTEIERRKQYKEYDNMEAESEVISTALDIYAEDSTDFDSFVGARIWITSNDDDIAAESNALLKKIRIDKNLPRIARNLAKYGDYFVGVVPNKSKEEQPAVAGDKRKNEDQAGAEESFGGVERIDTTYYPRDVLPIVRGYKLLGYWIQDQDQMTQVAENQLKAPWEFVHFAIPGDANFVTYDTPLDYGSKREDLIEYGQSLLKSARKPYKRSKLMHDILAITRISRSPLKRVFKFQTDTNNPIAQITALAMFKKTMEKIGGVDKVSESLQYDELMNIMTQDIYLPIGKDAKGDYAFDTLGGDVDVKSIVDIDMFDNRLFMSLRIPKEFLNFDAATGEKSTLLLKDIRYSKRIKKVQNALRSGIRELLFIHFALKGKVLTENDFEVNMASTSVSEDLERLDYYGNAVQTATSMIQMLDTFMVKVGTDKDGNPLEDSKYDRDYLAYYILKYVVKLPSFDMDKFNPKIAKYQKDANQGIEDKDKKNVKIIEQFVQDNKKLIESRFKKNWGTELKEATEELNTHLIKTYRTEVVPKNFKWDYSDIKAVCENMIAARIKKEQEKKNG